MLRGAPARVVELGLRAALALVSGGHFRLRFAPLRWGCLFGRGRVSSSWRQSYYVPALLRRSLAGAAMKAHLSSRRG